LAEADVLSEKKGPRKRNEKHQRERRPKRGTKTGERNYNVTGSA